MQQDFNDKTNARAAAPEGKRSGVTATEIVDTIAAIFRYFGEGKTDHPRLQGALVREAGGWADQLPALRGADQQALDKFFGQPSPKDVEAELEKQGIKRDKMPEQQFFNAYIRQSEKMTTDPQAYWPGKVVPTLGDVRSILAFDAYREKLDGKTGAATQLLARLDAFEGGSGSRHGSGNELYHEGNIYIQNTPRHPSETYVQPADAKADYGNAFHHTYNAGLGWKPSADLSTVSAERKVSHGAPERKSDILGHEKAKIEAALNERGGMSATVKVELGKTYADDKLVVTLSMDDYLNRFIPISKGEITIDTYIPNWGPNPNAFQAYPNYAGYEPGKSAYFEGEKLVMSTRKWQQMLGAAEGTPEAEAVRELRFGVAAQALRLTGMKLPVEGGEEDFMRVSIKREEDYDKVLLLQGRYYTVSDISDKMNRAIRLAEAALNGRPVAAQPVAQPGNAFDNAWFEHKGDIYVPANDRYHQIALHMQYQYGIKPETYFDDDEVNEKAADRRLYAIKTSELKPEDRTAALADLQARLEIAAIVVRPIGPKPKPFQP